MIVLLATAIGCAYCPWMAGYTEQVESHNPALAASGLAVWGWILRIVVAISFLVLPHVITTATTLVDNYDAGTELQALQTAQPYVPSTDAGLEATPRRPGIGHRAARVDHTSPAPNALAQILRNYPEDPPQQPARAPGVRRRPALRSVDRRRRPDSPVGTADRALAVPRHR